jgi:hypothetical protein
VVGKLDISWRYAFGESGHLQTHPLEQPVIILSKLSYQWIYMSFLFKFTLIYRKRFTI